MGKVARPGSRSAAPTRRRRRELRLAGANAARGADMSRDKDGAVFAATVPARSSGRRPDNQPASPGVPGDESL